MDKWQTTLRVEQIRREIAQIQGVDRIYKRHIAHTVEQNAEHEKRQQRLQEILAELDSLAWHPDQLLSRIGKTTSPHHA